MQKKSIEMYAVADCLDWVLLFDDEPVWSDRYDCWEGGDTEASVEVCLEDFVRAGGTYPGNKWIKVRITVEELESSGKEGNE